MFGSSRRPGYECDRWGKKYHFGVRNAQSDHRVTIGLVTSTGPNPTTLQSYNPKHSLKTSRLSS